MDQWHFNRAALADQYLGLLALGITSNLAIIAPRRKGKTLFMLNDLAPLAAQRGYLPVYASLWQNINAPHEGIYKALSDAVAELDKQTPISRLLKTKIKKTTVTNELLGKMELEFADRPAVPSSSELNQLDELLSTLEAKAGKKTVLLLIDEVQHLSTSEMFNPLAHALRTMLDKRQGRVKSVFTGSSRHYLDLLLNESNSPFYHFVEQHDFPDLDDGFIEFLRQRLNNHYGITVALPPLKNAFQSLDYSPYWMMKLISQMVAFKASVAEALEFVQQLIAATEDYAGIVQKMKPIDSIIFLAICDNQNIYSKDMLARVEHEAGLKGVPANVQRCVKRLMNQGLVSQRKGSGFYVEKPGLQVYIQQGLST